MLTIRRRTGMVFQNFQLFPHLTVIQNVMEGLLTVLKWDKEKARVRADELLEKVGIAHKADAWPCYAFRWTAAARSHCAGVGAVAGRVVV